MWEQYPTQQDTMQIPKSLNISNTKESKKTKKNHWNPQIRKLKQEVPCPKNGFSNKEYSNSQARSNIPTQYSKNDEMISKDLQQHRRPSKQCENYKLDKLRRWNLENSNWSWRTIENIIRVQTDSTAKVISLSSK